MNLRTILWWIGIALVVLWIVKSPQAAGTLVHNVIHAISHVGSSAGTAANTAVSG